MRYMRKTVGYICADYNTNVRSWNTPELERLGNYWTKCLQHILRMKREILSKTIRIMINRTEKIWRGRPVTRLFD